MFYITSYNLLHYILHLKKKKIKISENNKKENQLKMEKNKKKYNVKLYMNEIVLNNNSSQRQQLIISNILIFLCIMVFIVLLLDFQQLSNIFFCIIWSSIISANELILSTSLVIWVNRLGVIYFLNCFNISKLFIKLIDYHILIGSFTLNIRELIVIHVIIFFIMEIIFFKVFANDHIIIMLILYLLLKRILISCININLLLFLWRLMKW